MKRCDNCGWFNPDSAKVCEKCESDLSGIEPTVQDFSESAEDMDEPVPGTQPLHELSSPPDDVIEEDFKSVDLRKTVRKDESIENTGNGKHEYTKTVLDTSHIMEQDDEPEFCPKCRYPLARDLEFCPNCGVTLRRAYKRPGNGHSPSEEGERVPGGLKSTVMDWREEEKVSRAGVSEKSLKRTVRDVSSRLKDTVEDHSSAPYYLIPLDSDHSSPIPLVPGETVIIRGERYRFQK